MIEDRTEPHKDEKIEKLLEITVARPYSTEIINVIIVRQDMKDKKDNIRPKENTIIRE